MSENESLSYWKKHEMIISIGIVLISTILIVSFLPRNHKSAYDFTIGKPWKHGQLIAKYDFPIYKESATIKHEQDSVLRLYTPCFNFNTEKGVRSINLFTEFYTKNLSGKIPHKYFTYIRKRMSEVYNRGILTPSFYTKIQKDNIQYLMIVNNRKAVSIERDNFFSTKTAYEYIINSDTVNYQREILRQCNISNYLESNLTFDEEKSKIIEEDLLKSISDASGKVQAGEKIIDYGEMVDNHKANILSSLEKENNKHNNNSTKNYLMTFGQFLFAIIIITCFMSFLHMFRKDYFENPQSVALLFLIITLYPILTSIMVSHNVFSVYMIPYAAAPMIIRVFLDSRTAFITHISIILLCSIPLQSPYEFILLQSIAGIVAILSLKELSQRSQLFQSAVYITFISVALYTAYELVQGNDFTTISLSMYRSMLINGVLLLFVYLLMYIIERALGFTSNVTLVELSNINNKILTELSNKAPGTFQHSMQVANLAAEVANKIGAKSQLVRTGALYHDIGKLENPELFTENQTENYNPHKLLTYEKSAECIIKHVSNGVKIASHENLPPAIKNFILTHHGRSKTRYFYISYKNEHPDEEIDESLFTYPGPNPFTLEQGILMMADSIEAASRSLTEYNEQTISEVVDRMIDNQMKEGCFTNCPITFAQINQAKVVFKEKLKTIYHTRIAYPQMKNAEEEIEEEG